MFSSLQHGFVKSDLLISASCTSTGRCLDGSSFWDTSALHNRECKPQTNEAQAFQDLHETTSSILIQCPPLPPCIQLLDCNNVPPHLHQKLVQSSPHLSLNSWMRIWKTKCCFHMNFSWSVENWTKNIFFLHTILLWVSFLFMYFFFALHCRHFIPWSSDWVPKSEALFILVPILFCFFVVLFCNDGAKWQSNKFIFTCLSNEWIKQLLAWWWASSQSCCWCYQRGSATAPRLLWYLTHFDNCQTGVRVWGC